MQAQAQSTPHLRPDAFPELRFFTDSAPLRHPKRASLEDQLFLLSLLFLFGEEAGDEKKNEK